MPARLPKITVAIVPAAVAQLVIPGDDRAALSLAFRIASRALELLPADASWSFPYIDHGRATCIVLRIEGSDDANAAELTAALYEAAVSAARDGVGFSTHRIERI